MYGQTEREAEMDGWMDGWDRVGQGRIDGQKLIHRNQKSSMCC